MIQNKIEIVRCEMDNWTYRELIDAVNEDYVEFLREGLTPSQAAERCLYEYEAVCNQGSSGKAIVYCAISQMICEHGTKISHRQFVLLTDVLDAFDGHDTAKLDLSVTEAQDLARQVRNALAAIGELAIV